MSNLIHIRVGKGLKKQMDSLIEQGYYSNQAEIAREGIRSVLFRYKCEKEADETR
jgi:Arc/MetJ-type ribon-helix-helix transcriptional regulator